MSIELKLIIVILIGIVICYFLINLMATQLCKIVGEIKKKDNKD